MTPRARPLTKPRGCWGWNNPVARRWNVWPKKGMQSGIVCRVHYWRGPAFSGMKTAVLRTRDQVVAEHGGLPAQARHDLCAAVQASVADVLAEKTRRALTIYLTLKPAVPLVAVAGGVAANGTIRAALETICAEAGAEFTAPPLALCTDNGAMIAYAGWHRLKLGQKDGLSIEARPRWPMQELNTGT